MPFTCLSQTIMEQFNPSLRNFIAMGKNYEKALAGEWCHGENSRGGGGFRLSRHRHPPMFTGACLTS